MDGDKQVGLGLVGDVATPLKGDKPVVVTGHDHLYILHLLVQQFAQFQPDGEIDCFFIGFVTERAGILPSVTGVNHDHKVTGLNSRHSHGDHEDSNRDKTQYVGSQSVHNLKLSRKGSKRWPNLGQFHYIFIPNCEIMSNFGQWSEIEKWNK